MLAALGGAGLAALGNAPADAQTEVAETRTVALDPGWNLAGWTGPDTPLAAAIADIIDVTEAAAAFDARPQSFRTWNASAPAFLNTLDALVQGEAVWLLVTVPVQWVQPVVADRTPLGLRSGFNLVTWTGPSGLEPADTFAGIATDLAAAFAFDKPSETFTSFGPSRPAFLNDLAPLIYGDGFWVLMDAPASWAQPASPAPVVVALDDGSATLEIPRGALPPGLDPADIRVTAVDDPDAVALEGNGNVFAVFDLEPAGVEFLTPVFLTIPLGPGTGDTITVMHFAETGEVVEGITGALTADGRLAVVAPLRHFSTTTVITGTHDDAGSAGVDVVFPPVGEYAIGPEFTVSLTATRGNYEMVHRLRQVILIGIPGEPERNVVAEVLHTAVPSGGWSISNIFTAIGPIVPTEARSFLPDPAWDLANAVPSSLGSSPVPITQTYRCTAAGPFTITYKGIGAISQNLNTKEWHDGVLVIDHDSQNSGLATPEATSTGKCVGEAPAESFGSITPGEDLRYTGVFSGASGDCAGFPPSFSDATYVLHFELPTDPMMDHWSLRATQGSTNQAVKGQWTPENGAWFMESTDGSRLEVYRDGTTSPDGTLMATLDHESADGNGICTYAATFTPR